MEIFTGLVLYYLDAKQMLIRDGGCFTASVRAYEAGALPREMEGRKAEIRPGASEPPAPLGPRALRPNAAPSRSSPAPNISFTLYLLRLIA